MCSLLFFQILTTVSCAESRVVGADTQVRLDSSLGDADTDGIVMIPPEARDDREDWAARRPCDGLLASFVETNGDCRGQQPCFTTPQDAVDASSPGTTIWVYPGTYNATDEHVLRITDSLLCVRSVRGPAETILDGGGRHTVVRVDTQGALWLEGFTVTGCGDDGTGRPDGFALRIEGWSELRGWILGNIFEGNIEGDGVVKLTTFMVSTVSDIYISANIFRGNRMNGRTSRSVLHVSDSGRRASGLVRVENNVIIDNEGTAIAFAEAYLPRERRVELVNNTIVGNEIGLRIPVHGILIHNNVMVGNEMDVDIAELPGDASVQNNWFSDAPEYVGTSENRDGAIGFVNVSAGDYRLAEDSPARRAGTPESAAPFDVSGQRRNLLAPDIGAYESR